MCGIKNMHHGQCDCGSGRKLFTKEEKIEKLKQYQDDLEKELEAVKETLLEMTGEK